MSMNDPIGVVGTGLFGSAIVDRLLDDGFTTIVFNRTRAKAEPLLARGAIWSDNPISECRRVIFCLYTTDQVAAYLDGFGSPPMEGRIILDTSTSDPRTAISLGKKLAKFGVRYVESPFSGSSEQTRNHQSTALVAGEPESFEACNDLWSCLAAKTFYVGAWGNAAKMKLVTNLVLGLNRAVLAEGLVFAEAVGLEKSSALSVLLNSPAYARTMDAKGPKMVLGDFSPQARLAQHIKDVQLILEEASRGRASLPLSRVHLELLHRAVEMGLGEMDNSAIIRVINQSGDSLAANSSWTILE